MSKRRFETPEEEMFRLLLLLHQGQAKRKGAALIKLLKEMYPTRAGGYTDEQMLDILRERVAPKQPAVDGIPQT